MKKRIDTDLKNTVMVVVSAMLALSAVCVLLLVFFDISQRMSCDYRDVGVGSEVAQNASIEAVDEQLGVRDASQIWAETARIASMMTLNREYSVYFNVLPIIPGDFAVFVQMSDSEDRKVRELVHKKLAVQIACCSDMYEANEMSALTGPLQMANLHFVWVVKDDVSGDILGRYQLLDQDGDGTWDLATYDNTRRSVAKERFFQEGTIVTRVILEDDPEFDYGEVIELPKNWSGTVADIEEMFSEI